MSGQNPYEPPKVDVSMDVGVRDVEDLASAGLGARFLNFIIDGIISRVVATVAAGVALGIVGRSEWRGALSIGMVLGGIAGYYIVLESAFGWTIGKLITGTRVVRFDGDKANVPQIIGRTFARFIPFEPLSVAFGSSNQGWHDSLSGTRVVSVRR